IPFRFAVSLDIPLILWGESPVMEYGEDEKKFNLESLDHNFLRNHSILQGTFLKDWVDDDLSVEDLQIYKMPSESIVKEKKIQSLFLGYYFNWSPQESYRVAAAHGFQARAQGPKIGYYDYADIDCDFMSIHHYFKWYKFGFTRLFDNLSLEIRNGRLTRDQVLKVLNDKDEQRPDEDIRKFCKLVNITEEHFDQCAEKFRNKDIWVKQGSKWRVKDFIIKNWRWR
ncbi:MAG: N-acetyl sugar amidotransferase, partial [Candidatus Omnitrophota bacterium]